MNREKFFAKFVETVTEEELLEVHDAYWLAKRVHQDQKRDNGERYFEHCRRVALVLMSLESITAKTLIVSLLHDCLEDGFINSRIIERLFGKEILNAIEILSKTSPIFYPNGFLKKREPKTIKDYHEGIASAPEWIRKIKLADRIDNLNGLESWEEEKKKRYVENTEVYLLPIARNTNPELTLKLESLCEKIKNDLIAKSAI